MRTPVLVTVILLLGGAAVFPLRERPAAGPSMEEAARTFLASLPPELRAKAALPFAGEDRVRWAFVPGERKGASLKEMPDAARRAAHDLLRSALSARGYLKVTAIFALDQVLREMEQARGGSGTSRDQELYWFAVFGEPGAKDGWGWRAEGHHVSLNFSSVAGEIAATPAFLGTNPAEIRSGPRTGLKVLAAEEDLARALLASLDLVQRKSAVIADQAPADIILGPERKEGLGAPRGLAHAAMNPAQRDLLWRLVREYAENLRGDLASGELARIEAAGRDGIHFAWAGGLAPGEAHYYRIHGPGFVIEYDCIQNEANHVHTVWHDLTNDFGQDLLRRHREHGHERAPQAEQAPINLDRVRARALSAITVDPGIRGEVAAELDGTRLVVYVLKCWDTVSKEDWSTMPIKQTHLTNFLKEDLTPLLPPGFQLEVAFPPRQPRR